MATYSNENRCSSQPALVSFIQSSRKLVSEEEIQLIIQYWIRILEIKLGWVQDFDRIVVKYATNFTFEEFRSSSKLLKTFTGHTDYVNSIDFFTFDNGQFICSGSDDKTVRVWDVDANEQIRSFDGHSGYVYCVKFSQYHHNNNRRSVICSSSDDKTIRFWDIKDNQQLQVLNGHINAIYGIAFSSFNSGRYLCSTSADYTIRLWDVETYKSLHVFNEHKSPVRCVDISPLQSSSQNNKSNSIGVIGGNGYTICSGSLDKTIRIWDIEKVKQLIIFKGHEHLIRCVKYGSNKLENFGCAKTILSGSNDESVRLWDIRSGQQIQVFNGHKNNVNAVEYSPFVIDNIEVGSSSNVICSGSLDNTIRFWDIRSKKRIIYDSRDYRKDCGILCIKFLQLKNRKRNNGGINMCYGSHKGPISIWR
ncbi:G-protein beta WD-40 repeats containing protein [Reticulomyxa filosa]|uniref:G-protein beta WD-40 repeats containing protein n=1 Tax=Reticulomyxa filosa TaxID=46433 RepID=X6NIN5_RETFI|nr:G-protein beta WD-40 repeats containing protein [Reticulomyxa filosa]|eukprot:ETO25763.1 G-protein beta WD-40 repeats containing protein [Reticulomyxa filosa]